MSLSSQEKMRRRAEIAREQQSGAMTNLDAGTKLIEADPDYAGGYVLLASCRVDEGDLAGAEAYAWQALERIPCDSYGYLLLAQIVRAKPDNGLQFNRLMALGCWKIFFQDKVPKGFAELLKRHLGESEVDFDDPSEYSGLAMALEETSGRADDPADPLFPYALLNDIEANADDGFSGELLDRILQHSAALIPLLRAALREWWKDDEEVSIDVFSMILALLGEAGAPEDIEHVLQFVAIAGPQMFLHANWALWRLGQRFPAETLAAFCRLAGADRVSQRCAAAEHIALLPEIPGREAVTSRLLEGFAEVAKDNDGPVLLAAVARTLEDLGRPTDADRVLRQHQKLLSKDGREWLMEEIEGDFVGRLADAEIEGLTISEICCERILMDEEDLDDEDAMGPELIDEDEDDDFSPEPFIVPVKPGRNEPCWCGSGKKYKKCHLAADEEAERGTKPPAQQPVHERLYQQLVEGLEKWHGKERFKDAASLYFGKPEDGEEIAADEDMMTGFFDWCIHDFRPRDTGRTLVEECLRRRAGSLSAEEREMLEAWRTARYGIWEVQKVKPGEGVELKDWFEGNKVFVHDVNSSRSMVQWDCVESRVYQSGDRWYFAGNGRAVPRDLMDRLAERIESESREAGQGPAEFVRANSHRWHREVKELFRNKLDNLRVVNAEGDQMEFSTAEYRVDDDVAVAAALSGAKPFEVPGSDEPGVRSFEWMEQAEGPRRSYGHIEIRDGKLRLECNSRKRLAIGRQLLEKHAGKWLHHEAETFQSVDELKQKAFEKAGDDEERPLPSAEEREMLLQMKAQHYEHWVDEEIPALDGMTPRQAARSKTGRKALEDLLRMMENSEERARARGGVAYDFSIVRKKLGM